MIFILYLRTDIAFPVGIAQYLDLSILLSNVSKAILISLIIVSTVMYLFERFMMLNTLFIFVLSVAVFTIEKSNGYSGENGMVSMIFLAQHIAYFFIPSAFQIRYQTIEYNFRLKQ